MSIKIQSNNAARAHHDFYVRGVIKKQRCDSAEHDYPKGRPKTPVFFNQRKNQQWDNNKSNEQFFGNKK
jgi:hypothetical protein